MKIILYYMKKNCMIKINIILRNHTFNKIMITNCIIKIFPHFNHDIRFITIKIQAFY